MDINGVSTSLLGRDELEFYIDLAMNESQRWLETVTRERFLDEDDFLYSLRHGTQLRKLLNRLCPGSFVLPYGKDAWKNANKDNSDKNDTFVDQKITRTTSNCDDEQSWIWTFLRLCRTALGIPLQRLFRLADLDTAIGQSERDECTSSKTLDKVRRVVVTIGELARLYETTSAAQTIEHAGGSLGPHQAPRIDKSALEPLTRYHDFLWSVGEESEHFFLAYGSPRIQRTATGSSSATNENLRGKNECQSKSASEFFTARLSATNVTKGQPVSKTVNDDFGVRAPKLATKEVVNDDAKWEDAAVISSVSISPPQSKTEISYVTSQLLDLSISSTRPSVSPHPSNACAASCFDNEIIDENKPSVDAAVREKVAKYLMETVADETVQSRQDGRRVSVDNCPIRRSSVLYDRDNEEEHMSEYSFECSRSLSPDGCDNSSIFDTASVSISMCTSVTETARPKSEKRTVRSTKNSASKDLHQRQQAKVRRTSGSVVEPAVIGNPLKFIQAKSDLDLRAKTQLDQAKENRKKRQVQKFFEQEQEKDWAADLEKWKMRRSSSIVSVREDGSRGEQTGRSSATDASRGRVHSYQKMNVDAVETSETAAAITSDGAFFDDDSNTDNANDKSGNDAAPSTTVGGGENVLSSTGVVTTQNGAPNKTTASGATTAISHKINATNAKKDDRFVVMKNSTVSVTDSKNKNAVDDNGHLGDHSDESDERSSMDMLQPSRARAYFAQRSNYGAGSTQDTARIRLSAKDTTGSIAPVYTKIPEDTATDSGVDLCRPESLTPSRGSLSSGSPRSVDNNGYSSNSKATFKNGDAKQKPWNYYASKEDTEHEFIVSLEQKPDHEKCFGFTVKGGFDKKAPVIVESVFHGSTADKSNIRVGDEVLEIDGMDVSKAYLTMINATILQAAKTGCIELKLRRAKKKYSSSSTDNEESIINALTEKSKKGVYDRESSFDAKRLQFEKASLSKTEFNGSAQAASPVKTTIRPWHREQMSKSQSSVSSPPPVNRYDVDVSSIGQIVARYTGDASEKADVETRRRPMSQDRDFRSRWDTSYGRRGVAEESPANVLDGHEDTTASPYAERRRQPGSIKDFVPEIDRNDSPPTPGDYRVTNVSVKKAPGNILNFVPESERNSQNAIRKSSITDSVMQSKDILKDAEEIDMRWQREKQRVLERAVDTETKPHSTNGYARPEPTRNFALDRNSSDGTEGRDYMSKSRITEVVNNEVQAPKKQTGQSSWKYSQRSLSPPRDAPPPPPAASTRDMDVNNSSYDHQKSGGKPVKITQEQSNTIDDDSDFRPYGHVRRSPIAFAYEPILAKNGSVVDHGYNGSKNSHASVSAKNSVNIKREDLHSPAAPRRIAQPPVPVIDKEVASRKLDDLLRKQRQAAEVELQYLEIAASAAATGVDVSKHQMSLLNSNASSPTPVPMPRMGLGDIHQHWLVREAEDLRLTEQRRQEQQNGFVVPRRDTSLPPTASKGENRLDSNYRRDTSQTRGPYPVAQQPLIGRRPPSPKYPTQDSYSHGRISSNVDEKSRSDDQQVVAVSSTQKCSHCDKELGRGAAMIIESLNLFYHLECFKCYVCGMALGDGAHGADVRVRTKKLHCQRCYSNDDAGLKFSEV